MKSGFFLSIFLFTVAASASTLYALPNGTAIADMGACEHLNLAADSDGAGGADSMQSANSVKAEFYKLKIEVP